MSRDYSSHPGLKSKTGYMNHPLRRATLAAEMFTHDKYEGVAVSLVHNILEVTSVTIEELVGIVGEPLPTAKNEMTRGLYPSFGFQPLPDQGQHPLFVRTLADPPLKTFVQS